jgi:Fe-S oxidoreductase
MESGKLEPKAFPVRATCHDACYLGRHGGEYEAPRKILSSIPGIELVEMDQNRNNALCCGGGGGNFFTDVLGGETDSPNRIRVRQALETGAELLIVSCPQCARMLEDAIKAEGVENRLSVKDAGELLDVCVLRD